MKAIVLFILTVFLTFQSSAQVPDSVYHKRLFYLCKAWGHIKYFHTETADGNVNWDDELLAAVNGIKTAPDNAAFNDSLLLLLNSAGVMGVNNGFLPGFPDSLNNNTDVTWIQDPIFSSPVSALLDTVRVRFRPQYNVYVDEAWAGGNPVFDMDDQYYVESNYPTEEKRILALFRYWNCINYFFPYKYMMDQDWDATLTEFIPEVVEAQDALSYNLAFRKMTTRINDSHGFYGSPVFSNWIGNGYTPFLARYIEDELVITKTLPQITAVQVGDVILEIDGVDITTLRDSLRDFVQGSNDVVIERNLNQLILRGVNGTFPITVDDGVSIHSETLTRNGTNGSLLSTTTDPAWSDTLVNGNCHYGIVDMGILETNQVAAMFNDLWNTDAIIFDVRNYPNGTLWDIVDYLYPSSINIANFTTPDILHPGRLKWQYEFIGNGTNTPYEGRVIILFDERTQSHAEYTCMSLEQFPNAVKIGSTTAAADGNVAPIYLPGNIITYATFLGTYYPDFTETQRIGIVPHYEVLPTIQGIRNGEDEVLNFALDCNLLEVEDLEIDYSVELFPNPAVNEIEYSFSNEVPQKAELVDVKGNVVQNLKIDSSEGVIDLSDLTTGLYIFRFQTSSGVQTKLISKQ